MKKLYGVIGNPIGHSMSPDIHNASLKDLGLDGHYHAFKVEENDLEDAVKGIRGSRRTRNQCDCSAQDFHYGLSGSY